MYNAGYNHYQTYEILLDISKTFDTVPVSHKCLLAKHQCYKIDNLVWKWIQSWLTECTNSSVIVHGASSKPILILSSVTQGTVLGPFVILFIAH